MRRRLRLPPFAAALVAGLAASLVVAAPAEAAKRKRDAAADLSLTAPEQLLDQGVAALRGDDPAGAIRALSELASRQPRNGTAQALLGLSYQMPYLAAFRYPARERLPLIAAPTLFTITASEPASLKAGSRELATRVRDVRVEEVGVTPESKAAAIAAFLGAP